MYTNINVCGVLLIPWMPEPMQDVVRASTLFILIAVSTAWFSGNLIEIYHSLIDSFTPDGIILSDSMKTGIVFFYDVLFHVVPFLILGLPHHAYSLFVAYGIIVGWFMLVRDRLPSIYSPKVSFDRGIIAAGIIGLILAGWMKR